MESFYDSAYFTYLVIPILIFIARIVDVTIGTIRIVMVSKGQKIWAPILGFFEVLVWLLAMAKIFQNLDNWVCYIAYAAGFATGNFIGLLIEEKLAFGLVKIQIITAKLASELIGVLKESGYGITHHDALGGTEKVSIIYSIIKRSDLDTVVNLIKKYNPNAFYTVEDVRFVNKGVFPMKVITHRWRKGK